MSNDVNVHLGLEGDQQFKAGMDGASREVEQFGRETDQAGRKSLAAEQGTSKLGESGGRLSQIFGNAKNSLAAYALAAASALVGIEGVRRAVAVLTEDMDRNAEAAKKQTEALMRLQMLGELFKEKPDLRKEVMAYAEFGRRPFEEVAGAWYNLRSKAGNLSGEQQQNILREALEMGRVDPEMPLDTLVDMFSLYAKKSQERDANRIQNVLMQTVTEAGGSGADVAQYMPQFLPIGMAGGLSAPESAGLWSYATTQIGSASEATTALRALFMGLQGKGTPESQDMLKGLGITPEMGAWEKFGILSQAQRGGGFGLSQAQTLAGQEGASLLLSMLSDPSGMTQTVSDVVGADRPGIDLAANALSGLAGADERAAIVEEIKRLDVAIANAKGSDVVALRRDRYLKELDLSLRNRNFSPAAREAVKAVMWAETAMPGYRELYLDTDPTARSAEDYQRGDYGELASGWDLLESMGTPVGGPGPGGAAMSREQDRPVVNQTIVQSQSNYYPVAGPRSNSTYWEDDR